MKELSKTFKHKGFNFSQIKRTGNKAIYKQQKGSRGRAVTYEVIIISNHNGYELGGQYIEPAETYPSTSQWGNKGWTFNDLEEAEAFFKKLKIKNKDNDNTQLH